MYLDIKIAKPEDFQIIQKYLPDSDKGAYIRKWLEAQSRGENLVLVAWATDEAGEYRPVGRVTLVMTPPKEEIGRFLGDASTSLSTSKVAGVESLHVDEKMRRKGIGEALMARFEEEAKKRGFNIIQLGVERTNVPAIELYKKMGYRDWGHGQVDASWKEIREGKEVTVTVQTDVLIKNL